MDNRTSITRPTTTSPTSATYLHRSEGSGESGCGATRGDMSQGHRADRDLRGRTDLSLFTSSSSPHTDAVSEVLFI